MTVTSRSCVLAPSPVRYQDISWSGFCPCDECSVLSGGTQGSVIRGDPSGGCVWLSSILTFSILFLIFSSTNPGLPTQWSTKDPWDASLQGVCFC